MKFEIIVKDITEAELPNILHKFTGVDLLSSSNKLTVAEIDSEDETSDLEVTGQVDSDGLPWDARIHSSNKKMGTDGKWAKRRGRTEEEYKAVKAEYTSAEEPTPAFVMPPVPAPSQYAQAPVPTIPPVVSAAVVAAPTPAPMPEASTEPNIGNILARIQSGFATGRMTAANITEIVSAVNAGFGSNINNITDISGNPQMVGYVSQLLTNKGL